MTQQLTEPKIKIHHFSETFMETPLYFQILCMKDSYFVWIGTSSIKLESMFASVPSPYGPTPSTTQLIGNYLEGFTQSLAARLTKRFGKMFYVSTSLPDTSILHAFAEKKLVNSLLELINKPTVQ
eukprot:Phypoly_transcript_30456.p1 GENE.Phypoly_transcript_30456~~Phypoly_transcript_30456.p1  ORF type:complete len:139 (-),score=12.79 Phypoly_transcript_30456:3-377(-)